MKKFALGVTMGFIASCGLAFAAANYDHNGVFWGRLDGSAKQGYVTGYADAMQVSTGKLDNLTVAAELFHWRGARKIINQLSHELVVSDVQTADVVARLNELYSNRKYSDLDLGSAMQLLTMRAGEHADRTSGKAAPTTR
jgi:hypothetical protein